MAQAVTYRRDQATYSFTWRVHAKSNFRRRAMQERCTWPSEGRPTQPPRDRSHRVDIAADAAASLPTGAAAPRDAMRSLACSRSPLLPLFLSLVDLVRFASPRIGEARGRPRVIDGDLMRIMNGDRGTRRGTRIERV